MTEKFNKDELISPSKMMEGLHKYSDELIDSEQNRAVLVEVARGTEKAELKKDIPEIIKAVNSLVDNFDEKNKGAVSQLVEELKKIKDKYSVLDKMILKKLESATVEAGFLNPNRKDALDKVWDKYSVYKKSENY